MNVFRARAGLVVIGMDTAQPRLVTFQHLPETCPRITRALGDAGSLPGLGDAASELTHLDVPFL